MTSLVLTGRFKYSLEQKESISKLGYNILFHEDEKIPFTEEELKCEVMVNLDALSNNDINDFKNLKFIQATMVGTDKVPMERIKEKGIKYCNSRGVFDIPIAEFVIMRLLEVYKHARVFEKQTEKRGWAKQFDMEEINGKNIAILGTGGIGIEVAKRLKAFGANVFGFNRSLKKAEYFDEIFSITQLKNRIGTFDAVIIAIPLTEETFHLFNDEMLGLMKDKSIIVNIGRGAIVCENALANALESGKLKAAVIDVFEKEPLSTESRLWNFDEFYFSPHCSFSSVENNRRMFELIYNNLKAYKCNGKLLSEVKL
ncbi:MAG: NAD(P)-dependent oxidoreductase [Lachnospiraceae bacterium]|nr:NAD(P)-dependent oxidoreductase [Lachnospiraceae bacterium]